MMADGALWSMLFFLTFITFFVENEAKARERGKKKPKQNDHLILILNCDTFTLSSHQFHMCVNA